MIAIVTCLSMSPRAVISSQSSPPPRKGSYLFLLDAWSRALEKSGFPSITLGMNYPFEDYNDCTHLSDDEAPRMAREVTRVFWPLP